MAMSATTTSCKTDTPSQYMVGQVEWMPLDVPLVAAQVRYGMQLRHMRVYRPCW
jgi:hypothetical protein